MAEPNVIPRLNTLDYDPSWSELFGSAFRNENVIGSAIQRLGNSRIFGDSDPTPVSDDDINQAVNDSGLTPFIEHFTSVQTRGDLNNKIAHVSQQARDRAILDKGGWAGFGAQLTAGVLDVPTLLPFGHAVRLGRLGTETLKTTASKLAVTAALDAGATEAALHGMQDLRTVEESAFAVGGSVLLTTALGTGIAKLLSKRQFDTASQRAEREIPRIADGRAEADFADQISQAAENTRRAMNGERLEPMAPPRDFAPGQGVREFGETVGLRATDALTDFPDGSMRSVLVGGDGKLYDLGDSPFQTHAAWMRAVDEAGDARLTDDIANTLQLTAFKNGGVTDIATGSQSALTRKQLQGIRNAAKSLGIDRRDLYFREDRMGGVEVVTFRDPARAAQLGDRTAFQPLSKYQSAENRTRQAELSGRPPEDPEMRQGVPTERWDGEAQDAPPTQLEARGGGPADGGTTPPGGGGSGSGAPPGGPRGLLEGPYAPEMTPSQMAFAESGGAIAATRGLTRLFGGSPILEMMNSSSTAARAWIMQVAELSGRTKGSYEGRANPIAVQSRMAEYEGMRANMTREFYAAYKGWRQGFDLRGRELENFSRNVSQSIVRQTFEDPATDPNVARAAKAIRDVIGKMYERAVEQGLIRKDAWKPGDMTGKNPFMDFDAARAGAQDTTSSGVGTPQDVVDFFLTEIAKPLEKGKRPSKFAKDEANVSRSNLSDGDADLVRQIASDLQSGAVALGGREADNFFKETGQRLARSGTTGERGLDYNVGLRFAFGPNGELGNDLVQRGGIINRRYTDRVAHEYDEFMRAETLAYLQDRDVQIREARKLQDDINRKAREDAIAKGEDPAAAEKAAEKVKAATTRLWHELSTQQKRATLLSGMNHAKGSWEFIVHGTIKGGDARVLGIEQATGRSPLLRRNVLLSDQVLLAKGWIDDDALGIASHTVRQIAADVELARVFRRPMENMPGNAEINDAKFGKPSAYWIDGADPNTVPDIAMIGPRKAIGAEFDEALQKLSSDPSNDAARNRLITERALILGGTDADGRQRQGLLDVVTEMIRGTHKISENSTRSALNLQALKQYIFSARMGANVLTNATDWFRLPMHAGYGNTLSHFAHRASGLVRSLADGEALKNLATQWKLPEGRVGAILAREARAAGIAVETDLMTRWASQLDVMDPFMNAKAKDTVFRQVADGLAKAGSKLYFINVMTNAVRRASYGIYVDRVVRAAMQPETIARHERDWLNDLGVTDAMLKGIRREVEVNKGAVLDGGVWHMQHDNWADARLRSDFWAAARKDANNANIAPSVLEKPLAFTNPIVNSMLQFWSFAFGAMMRLTAQSSQRVINGTDGMASDGARTMLGLLSMVAGGMGAYALHNYASTWRQRQQGTLDPRDELPDFAANPGVWLQQGLSRSGTLGALGQMGDVLDGIGINPVWKGMRAFSEQPELGDPVKKYGRVNAVKNVLGAPASLIDDLALMATGVAAGLDSETDVKRAQVRALQRNIPLVNAFYLKSLTKEATEYLNDEVLRLPPDAR